MSKSMWIDAETTKPEKARQPNNISIPVAFWVDYVSHPYWGHYDFHFNRWVTEDDREYLPLHVKYFAYIDNPYK